MGAKRTAEREEFLADIITTAAEGGTGYRAQISQYQYLYNGELCIYAGGAATGEGEGETTATLHELNDDADGYKAEGLTLTIDKIAATLGKIRRGELAAGCRWRDRIIAADRENDAGDIDADDADNIAQLALLGEIRYG